MSTTAKWIVQGNKRAKGTYYEAVRRNPGGKGRTVSLGYLTDEEAARAKDNLRAFSAAFEKTDGVGEWSYNADEIRLTLLRDPMEADDAVALVAAAHDRAMVAAGDYARMELRAFHDQVWVNVRPKDVAVGTWTRETWWWTERLLPVLGKVPLNKLDAVKWANFLANLEGAGGRTRAVVQGVYRSLLRYCVAVEILPSLHSFRPIKGAKTRTLARPKPLLPDEVARLLDHAPTLMHRALWATAIGQGLRPAEAAAVRWEDLDLDAGVLRVRGTKTDLSAGEIPLLPIAVTELRALRAARDYPAEGHAFLWAGHALKNWRKGLVSAARRAGIADGRRIFPNLARHTFATLAAVGGVPKAAAKAVLRHSHKSDLLEEAYTHPQISQVRDALASFPAIAPAPAVAVESAPSGRKISRTRKAS